MIKANLTTDIKTMPQSQRTTLRETRSKQTQFLLTATYILYIMDGVVDDQTCRAGHPWDAHPERDLYCKRRGGAIDVDYWLGKVEEEAALLQSSVEDKRC